MLSISLRAIQIAAFATLSLASVNATLAQSITLEWLSDQPQERYQPLIDAYRKARPNVQIQVQQVPFENLNAQVQARIGSGDSSPDMYAADTPRIPALANQGLLMDLEAYRSEIEPQVDAKSLESVSFEGKIWSFPQWNTLQLLFYNKDLLDKAGIEYPSANPEKRLTWEELLPIAKAAQEAGAARWGFGFDQVDRYYQLQPLFESSGAGPGLTGKGLLTPELTGDKWVETATWYANLYSKGLAPRGIAPAEMPPLFVDGKVAFFVGGVWNIARFTRAGARFGVAPIPYFKGGKPVTATGSWAFGINPHGKNVEAVIDFAKFLSLTKEGASLLFGTTGQMPSQKQAFEGWVQQRNKEAEGASELLSYELANTAVSRPRTIGYVAFEEVMNRTFSDIRNGADVRAALEQAQQQLTSVLGRRR
jgi:multiple sugar transport system substrate-binding protein